MSPRVRSTCMRQCRKRLLKSSEINEFLIGRPTPTRADSPNELDRNPWPLPARYCTAQNSMTLLLQDDACMIRHPVQVSIPFVLLSLCIGQRRRNKQSLNFNDVTLKISGSQSHPKLIEDRGCLIADRANTSHRKHRPIRREHTHRTLSHRLPGQLGCTGMTQVSVPDSNTTPPTAYVARLLSETPLSCEQSRHSNVPYID